MPHPMPPLDAIGFEKSAVPLPAPVLDAAMVASYAEVRDFPALEHGTTHWGLHLRFGTISVRQAARTAASSEVLLGELIWREFFAQVLWHRPDSAHLSFRAEGERIAWRHHEAEILAWQEGRTGYPLVDAGMRELLATGHMHNRARMVTASFLTKHLLTHWAIGERHFAKHLLDFDLASNAGNWQWAAGTGCDAAPYFRVFHPERQRERFDPEGIYVRRWVPEYGTPAYPAPLVEHTAARSRVLAAWAQVKAPKE